MGWLADRARLVGETVVGVVLLAWLVVRSRFRLGGAYWAWRRETALGGESRGLLEMLGAVLGYGRWMARMRCFSR